MIDNLQISCLEHRSESDSDVTPYVHERKVDLIEVYAKLCTLFGYNL